MAKGGNTIATAYVQILPSMEGVTSELSDGLTSSMKGAGKSAGSGFSGSFAGVLKKLPGILAGLGITSRITNFFKDSITAGMNFDTAMSQVAATMGVTVDDIRDLEAFAKEMGASTQFSATQAAEALNYMALANYSAEQSMQALPSVLNLAAAGAMDLARASDMVTDAQSALGIEFEDIDYYVDKLAKTASTTNTSVEQLGDAMLTVGGTAKMMQGGTTELAQVLGLLADNGIKGAEGGTALRNILLKLADPTAEAQKLIDDLGISFFDANGDMKSMQEIMGDLNEVMADMTSEERTKFLATLFNSRDLKAVNALLDTSADRWDEVGLAIEGAWYTLDSLNEQLGISGLSLDEMRSRMEELGVSAETFDEILGFTGGDAKEFADGLWEASAAGVKQEDVIAALGGDLDELQDAFDNTTGAAQAMAETQLDNLEGDVTILQSAMEGLQIELFQGVAPAFREVVQAITGFVSFVSSNVAPAFEALNAFFFGTETTVDEFDDTIMGTTGIFDDLGGAFEDVQAIVETVWPTIQDTITGVIEVLQEAFEVAWPFISDIVVTAFDRVRGVVETVWPLVSSIVSGAIDTIKGVIQTLKPIVDWVKGIFDGVKKAMEEPIQKARDLIKGAIDKIKGFFEFKIQWPHIPLPHFSISGSINPLDWISQGVPKISIDWYAKGGYVDDAVAIAGESPKGGEFIWPDYEPYLDIYADALAKRIDKGGGDSFEFNITADSETTLQRLVEEAQRARLAYGRA